MNNISDNNKLNLSLADQTYLRWYEITNALSHAHMDVVFSRFQQHLEREIRKNGSSEMSTATVIRCFREVTQKVARSHTLQRFESTLHNEDEAA